MNYVGIDIGSTASKAVVMDEEKQTVLYTGGSASPMRTVR